MTELETTGAQDIAPQFQGASESSPTQVSSTSWHPEDAAIDPLQEHPGSGAGGDRTHDPGIMSPLL